MSTQIIQESEIVSRSAAIWGSATAAILFGFGFATDRALISSIAYLANAQAVDIAVYLYLGLLLAVFLSYLLAVKKRFEVLGSVLAIAAVVAIYAWCKIGLNLYPGPYLIALAFPALFHLMAVSFHRFSLKSEGEDASPELLPAAA